MSAQPHIRHSKSQTVPQDIVSAKADSILILDLDAALCVLTSGVHLPVTTMFEASSYMSLLSVFMPLHTYRYTETMPIICVIIKMCVTHAGI